MQDDTACPMCLVMYDSPGTPGYGTGQGGQGWTIKLGAISLKAHKDAACQRRASITILKKSECLWGPEIQELVCPHHIVPPCVILT